MSFWKRSILTIGLLLFLGVPLSATYYEPAQTLPAGAEEDLPLPPDDGEDPVPGAPAPAVPQEESTG